MVTVQCRSCKKYVQIPVTLDKVDRWRTSGELIQEVMPEVPPALREMFISGTCPQCWDKLFERGYRAPEEAEHA